MLGALFSVVLNFRMHEKFGTTPEREQLMGFMEQFGKEPETKNETIVPLEEFTEEKLEFCRRMNLSAIIQTWGLAIHHPTLPPELIEEFLARRFGYWSDDVEHVDPFA